LSIARQRASLLAVAPRGNASFMRYTSAIVLVIPLACLGCVRSSLALRQNLDLGHVDAPASEVSIHNDEPHLNADQAENFRETLVRALERGATRDGRWARFRAHVELRRKQSGEVNLVFLPFLGALIFWMANMKSADCDDSVKLTLEVEGALYRAEGRFTGVRRAQDSNDMCEMRALQDALDHLSPVATKDGR